jgi:hypothetical protein
MVCERFPFSVPHLRHGPARPGHLSRHRAGSGGPDKPGHDVDETIQTHSADVRLRCNRVEGGS